MDIIEKYAQDVAADAAIDEINVKEVAMRLPGIKHKWVARLINHKRPLYALENERAELVERTVKKIKEKNEIQLSKTAMISKISSFDTVKSLDDKMSEQKAIIEYLEHVESIFRYMTNDVKNVIEIMKMELT
jgi:hypothetical protein